MKNQFCSLLLGSLLALNMNAQSTIKIKETTLMHEMRATPSPLNNTVVSDRSVVLLWPLSDKINMPVDPLDGMESKVKPVDKSKLKYQVRYSSDPALKKGVTTATTRWPFHNPEPALNAGIWYWQYGYVENGQTRWSPTLQFTVKEQADKFCPPSLNTLLSKMPQEHPRIWMDSKDWNNFRNKAKSTPEYQWYTSRAEEILNTPMQTVKDIKTDMADGLDNEVMKQAMLTRESRRIIDKEEANTEVLIRSYLLTLNKSYFLEAMSRIEEMTSWKNNKAIVGDFNAATMLSLCSMAYDSFYNLLSATQKKMLLAEIKEYGNDFYKHFNNHLENHNADNHSWQMTFRTFTMAAFSVYKELPEADIWVDYCYNLWLARFPGLNKDGGWHEGDSYFHVNIRTLIEIPYLYSRITGFDYFSDPWYQGSAMYGIFAQPPFSHASGNGSSHRKITAPSGVRVGYLDALARLTGNTYAADYVRRIQEKQPTILKKAFMAKPGDVAWFRLQYRKPLPTGKGLNDLPLSYVFPATGLALLQSDWTNIKQNAMVSFRSSPFGSTSHAVANQNSFNTFFAGEPLFYSSGHHIAFTDPHSIYCHRATRAHNSILVNGMGQRIGMEGYGWIPRSYVGKKISYVVGDASNAYGEVISPLWKERGVVSKLEFSPANGWDKNHLKTFRRHIVALEGSSLIFIYDELEADTAVTWDYLLHTASEPMSIAQTKDWTHIRTTNQQGASDAYLFAPEKLKTEQTDQFFYPAVNWLRANDKGVFDKLENHWHFTAKSSEQKTYRFATVVSTHEKGNSGIVPEVLPDGRIKVGQWIIEANITTQSVPSFFIQNTKENTQISYQDATIIHENGNKIELTDTLPELEI